MQFGLLGIDYKNADLAVRDEISFTDQKKMEFFRKAEENGIDYAELAYYEAVLTTNFFL